MAEYSKGILGPFNGTVGTVVGVTWRGKDIMRSKPKKTDHAPTALQLRQRMKFLAVVDFLNPIKAVLSKLFGHKHGAQSTYNLATSYSLNNLLEWNGVDFTYQYNKFLFSRGDLQGLQDVAIVPQEDRKVKITWSDNSGQGLAQPTDKLYVLVYEPSMKQWMSFEQVAERVDSAITLTVSEWFLGFDVEVWACFYNEDLKKAATSSYLGSVLIG
jgi:hypothetical protein